MYLGYLKLVPINISGPQKHDLHSLPINVYDIYKKYILIANYISQHFRSSLYFKMITFSILAFDPIPKRLLVFVETGLYRSVGKMSF